MNDWTYDIFQNNLEATKNYATKPRISVSFIPTENETLATYTQRLVQSIEEQTQISTNAHINGPKGPWYTHKTPSGCFICNQGTIALFSVELIAQVQDAIPRTKDLIFKKYLNQLQLRTPNWKPKSL